MSNFGAGQGLFGSNQNKNQGTSTPAASAFANLGANTTSSSVFGGLGAGNTPGGGVGGASSAPSGGIFGGGSAFGSSTNTNAPTSNPSGAGTGGSSLFAANPTTNTGTTGPAGGGLFSNASLNPGTSGTAAGQGLFGNTTGATAGGGGAGGPMFGFPKPAASGASPFASGTGAAGGGGGLFSGAGNSSAAGSAAGGTAPATTGTTTASSNAFGGGLFANMKPADSAAKPATSSFFSAPVTGGAPSMGAAATGNTSSLFPSLASKPGETSTSSNAAPTTQPSGSAFRPQGTSTAAPISAPSQSAFGLGAPAATGAASTTATAGGGLFGNIGATANKDGKPEEKKNGTSTALPTFSLGGQPTGTATAPAAPSTDKRDGMAAPSLFSGLGASKPATSLGGSTSTGTAPGTLALTATTTSAISVAPPSMLKGKSIEEIINRWSNELENHVRDFNKFGTEVAVWDRSLIDNGNNLAALYGHVLAAEREQNDIDQSLDHIEQQEKELAATVEMYEKQMSDILGGQGGTLRTLDTGPADTERDKNYMLATELHNHLDDLSSSLTQLIESVNSMSIGQNDGKAASADDPMAQIAHVLGNHLESLQWIDGASRELEEKVVEVEKRIKDVGTGSQATPAPGGGSRSRGFGVNW